MKIETYNINQWMFFHPASLAGNSKPRRCLPAGIESTSGKIPEAAIHAAGYGVIWQEQKSWNGIAILAGGLTNGTRRALPGDLDDTSSRYIEAAVKST